MEIMVMLVKGGIEKTVSVNNADVSITGPDRVEKRETGDVNEKALAWSKEMISGGWTIRQVILHADAKQIEGVIAALPVIPELSLNGNPIESIAPLHALKGLRSLQINGPIADLSPLAKLQGLESLSLYNLAPETSLEPIGSLPKLTELSLGHENRYSIGGLPPLPSVTHLRLQCDFEGSGAELVRKVPKLTKLGLYGAAGSLDYISSAKLVSLTIDRHLPAGVTISLAPIGRLAGTLESLEISWPQCSFSDGDAIGKCTRLKRFTASNAAIDPASLAKLTSLEELSFTGGEAMDADAVGKLTALTTLTFDGGVATLAPFTSLTKLKSLTYTGDGAIKDFAPLAELPLEKLELPEKPKPKAAALKPLVKHAMKIDWNRRIWSAKDLHGFLEGTFKLPTLKDAAIDAIPFKSKKGTGKADGSHTGGTPWLAKGESWPLCRNCKRPMPLFLQVELDSLKLPKKVMGLLQLFYCNATDPHCEVVCETWKGSGKSLLLRVVTPSGTPFALEMPEFPSAIPEKALEFGTKKEDLPFPDDAEDRYGIRDAADRTVKGDKLGGWPAWVQGPEWPRCPDCATEMAHVVQLESNKAVAHQWGDLGRAHLFVCAEHPARTGFCWASG